MMGLYLLILFLIGVTFGSYLNAWIWRTRFGKSILSGRSCCVHCDYTLTVIDLIPVVSYGILKGKCKKCDGLIPKHYPTVEIVVGVLAIFVALYYALAPFEVTEIFLRDFVILYFLLFIFIYDALYMEILDRVTLIPAAILFVVSLFMQWNTWSSMLIGALVGSGFFLVQYVISKGKWIGGGDIRLGALMGVILGWKMTLVALFVSYIIGALYGVVLLIAKKKDKKTEVPFGVFLTIGTAVVMFWGVEILSWYIGLL
jgi:leader peptidase (prepilin peptidase) / N-methyltransferase